MKKTLEQLAHEDEFTRKVESYLKTNLKLEYENHGDQRGIDAKSIKLMLGKTLLGRVTIPM